MCRDLTNLVGLLVSESNPTRLALANLALAHINQLVFVFSLGVSQHNHVMSQNIVHVIRQSILHVIRQSIIHVIRQSIFMS